MDICIFSIADTGTTQGRNTLGVIGTENRMHRLFGLLILILLRLEIAGQDGYDHVYLHPDTIEKKSASLKTIFATDSFDVEVTNLRCFDNPREVIYHFQRTKDDIKMSYVGSGDRKFKRDITPEKLLELQKLFEYALRIEQGNCDNSDLFLISSKTMRLLISDERCFDDIFPKFLDTLEISD